MLDTHDGLDLVQMAGVKMNYQTRQNWCFKKQSELDKIAIMIGLDKTGIW